MNQSEVIKLFQMIDIDYPNNQIAKDADQKKLFAARWMQKLGPYEARQVYAAYEMHAMRSPSFAPNWQHLIAIIGEALADTSNSAEQAWSRVYKAIRSHGHTEPDRAESELGELWALVGRDWAYYCTLDESQTPNEKARFIRMYTSEQKKATERMQIPATIRAALSSGKLMIGDGT